MKKKIYYIVIAIGFVIGVLFYLFNLAVINAETSSIDPNLNELFRNSDYFTVILYGLVGAAILFLLTSIIRIIKIR